MTNALATIGEGNLKNNGSELIQLVSFNIGNEEYGVEVLKVREIIRLTKITTMPNSPNDVSGIINLRGKVIPIISVRSRFALKTKENDNRTRIVVMDVDGELVGFIVDSVSEVIRISSTEIQPAPAASSGDETGCITGIINRGDRLIVLLNLELLADYHNPLFIAA